MINIDSTCILYLFVDNTCDDALFQWKRTDDPLKFSLVFFNANNIAFVSLLENWSNLSNNYPLFSNSKRRLDDDDDALTVLCNRNKIIKFSIKWWWRWWSTMWNHSNCFLFLFAFVLEKFRSSSPSSSIFVSSVTSSWTGSSINLVFISVCLLLFMPVYVFVMVLEKEIEHSIFLVIISKLIPTLSFCLNQILSQQKKIHLYQNENWNSLCFRLSFLFA